MKKRIKGFIRAALLSPLGAPLSFLAGSGSTCLMYHHIAPGPMKREPRFQPNLELFVAEEEFEKQIRYLATNYDCLSVAEAVELLQRAKLPRRSATVTFDDGYRDNLLALPILKRYNVPATIYITTGGIAGTRTFWWDEHETILSQLDSLELTWRGKTYRWDLGSPSLKLTAFLDLNRLFKARHPMEQDELLEVLRAAARTAGIEPPYVDANQMLSWDELTALDREPLITIGAHTIDHYVMSRLRDEELHRQIVDSRGELQHRLGHPIEHFAYPFGREEHAAEREFSAVAQSGFTSAVTTRPAHWRGDARNALHALPRIAVDYSDTLDDFRWKLSGFAAALQRREVAASQAAREATA